MVFPPTYLPGGLLSGVPATTSTEVVRLDQIQGAQTGTTRPLIPARLYTNTALILPTSGQTTSLTFTPAFTPLTGDGFILRLAGSTAANGASKVITFTCLTDSVLSLTTSANAAYFTMDWEVYKAVSSNASMQRAATQVAGAAPVPTYALRSGQSWTAFSLLVNTNLVTTADVILGLITIDFIPAPV